MKFQSATHKECTLLSGAFMVLLLSLAVVPHLFISVTDFGLYTSLMAVCVGGMLWAVTALVKKEKISFSTPDILLAILVVWQVFINIYFGKLTVLWITEMLGYTLFYLLLRVERVNFKPIAIAITMLCLAEAIYGLLQYVGWAKNNTSNFPIGGTFDTPAGYGVCLVIGLSFALYFVKEGTTKSVQLSALVAIILFLLGIALSQSRASYLAVLIISVGFILSFHNIRNLVKKHKTVFLFSLVLFICLFLVILYFFKQNSSNGRVFIYSTTLSLLSKSPLQGLGYSAFEQHYMLHQAEALKTTTEEIKLLADNVRHPLNEYLSFLLQYGLIGFTIFTVYLFSLVKYRKKSKQTTDTYYFILCITGIATVAFFSYSFNYPFVVFVLLLAVARLTDNIVKVSRVSVSYKMVGGVAILIAGFVLYQSTILYKTNKHWKKTSDYSLQGETERMLPYYEKLMNKLYFDPLFLYNYAAELNYSNHPLESNKILEECMLYLNDYDVQLMLGDNYEQQGNYLQAEHHFRIASEMIPVRFVPLYRLALLYKEQGDTDKAVTMAKLIVSKKIKVNSAEVQSIISEMKGLIDNQ